MQKYDVGGWEYVYEHVSMCGDDEQKNMEVKDFFSLGFAALCSLAYNFGFFDWSCFSPPSTNTPDVQHDP